MSGMERARSATSPQAQCEGSVRRTTRPPSSPAKYTGQQQVPDEAGTKSLGNTCSAGFNRPGMLEPNATDVGRQTTEDLFACRAYKGKSQQLNVHNDFCRSKR